MKHLLSSLILLLLVSCVQQVEPIEEEVDSTAQTESTEQPAPTPAPAPQKLSLLYSKVENIQETQATIWWGLSDYATGQVEYWEKSLGKSASIFHLPAQTGFNYKEHGFIISGLKAGTAYQYILHSKNQMGTSVDAHAPFEFKTLASVVIPDPNPIISNLQASSIKKDSAIISWSIDIASNARVEFGKTQSLGSVQNVSSFLTSHSITLLNLDPDTTYFYRVLSSTTANKSASSSIMSFKTVKEVVVTPPPPPVVSDKLKAFPSVEGAGWNSVGGRGGKVLHVTRLDDAVDGSGNPLEGTFRWAIFQKYPRIVVFDISGVIELDRVMGTTSTNGYLTIAGQTAPRGGVTIRHYGMYFNKMDHVIIRFIRFEFKGRFHPDGLISRAAFYFEGVKYGVLDHCSIRYSWGSAALAMWDANRKQGFNTVQRSLLSNSQTGALVGAASIRLERNDFAGKNTFHHNLFAHISHRFPNVNGNGEVEVINNVAYNYIWKLSSVYNKSKSSFINNYYRGGPSSSVSYGARLGIGDYLFDYDPELNKPQVYTRGNVIDDRVNQMSSTYDSWDKFVILYNLGTRINVPAREDLYRTLTPFAPLGEPVTTQTALEAYDSIIKDVGANAYLNADGSKGRYSDTVDTRNINDTINKACEACEPNRTQPSVVDASVMFYPIPSSSRASNYDTDRDGMPDQWELANGLNPSVDDSAEDIDGDGYTNIEEFLNMVDL